MTLRYSEQWEIQRLKNIIIFSWDNEMRKNAVDTLSSYRKNAIPTLADIASWTAWDNELREYVLDKIRQIKEGII